VFVLSVSLIECLPCSKIDCGGRRREVSRVYDISRSEAEALRLFRLISRGRVTPCCLHEMVEELMAY